MEPAVSKKARAAETVSSSDSTPLPLERLAAPAAPVAGIAFGPDAAPTMRVGSADDPAEVEADAVARTVVDILRSRQSAPITSTAAGAASPMTVQRAARTIGAAGGVLDGGRASAIDRLRGTRSPLPPHTRAAMESAFATDLSDVNVHVGAGPAAMNDELGAHAFTVGSDIMLAGPLPDMGTEPGQHLLAHEIAHVLQARRAGVLHALRRETLRRHPGTEALTAAHDASAHTSPKDTADHDREQQTSFDHMSSDQFVEALTPVSVDGDKVRTIPLAALPPKLQAQVRMIQSIVTEIETELAKDEPEPGALDRLAARVKTGARSWHENDNKKVPIPTGPIVEDSAGEFFEQMRMASGGKVPTKQAKKGVTGKRYPFREYTAVGWKEAAQSGRLIFDPIGDVFYLTCKHYLDDKYFAIVAPRPRVGAPGRRTTEWDFDLLVYQAWEELAADLQLLAQHKAAPKKNAAPTGIDVATISDDASACVTELYLLREMYGTALLDARRQVSEKVAAIDQYLELKAKMEARRQKFAGKTDKLAPYEIVDGKVKIAEQFGKFTWCGGDFYVGSIDGYIGYLHKGSVVAPAYDGSTIGALGSLFRSCVATRTIDGTEEAACLMLASLVAEASRHPAATLEALFAVLKDSPFASKNKAFGTSLPMAAGGTIATGGIAIEVMLQEARLGVGVIGKKLLQLDSKGAQKRVTAVKKLAPTAAIAELKSWLFTALQTPEAQRGVVSPEVEEPPTGDAVTAEAPVSTIRPGDAVLPDTAPKTAVVTLVGSDAL